MAQNVLLKYGDTSVISGETVQQGKILIDTQKAEISIDKDGTNRIKLTPTVDSALSTTSTNPVQNTIVTTSLNQKVEKTDVINDLVSAMAVTATNVPAGCGVIKELNESLVKIVVSCRNDLIGKTVMCTNGDKNYSAIVGINLEVVFNVGVTGNWIVSCDNFSKVINANYYGLYNVNFQFGVYGVDIDLSKTNPTTMCTYTDDAIGMEAGSTAWDDVIGHKPCVFKDGQVLGYLNPDDFSKYADGTNADISTVGNDVMIEFPKRGYKITTANNIISIRVTDEPDNPEFCYKPFSRATEGDRDAFYYGAYKSYSSGSKLYSSSGKTPTASKTRATYRAEASARGTGYAQNGFYQLTYIQCMYLLKFKNLNSQATIGTGYVLSSHTACISTGGTNAYGMDSEIIKASNPTYMTDQNHPVKCLGIEDFWGNIWQWVDGFTTDASHNMFTCYIPSLFSDSTTATGQENQGKGANSNIGNYMSKPQGGTDTGFVAKEVAGSDSTYFCDYAYLSASCVMIFGGYWDNVLSAGAFQLNVSSASSASYVNAASRLMYV